MTGRRGDLLFVGGALAAGETQPSPLIREVLSRAPDDQDVIIDSPPGASCSMLTVAAAADVVLLATEPTPFGLHDLRMAVRAIRQLDRPMAVVINRCDWGDGSVRRFCHDEHLPVLLEIPHLREVAQGYTRAVPLIESAPQFGPALVGLQAKLRSVATGATA
jgi:MinD superfamily P-loop ATPase